jgi:hypothetical protein
MPLHQIAFEQKRFKLRLGHDGFDIMDLFDEDSRLGTLVGSLLKVGSHTIEEHPCLAYIQDFSHLSLHQIHSRLFGKML